MASWINANKVGGPSKATEQKGQRPLRVALTMYNEMPSGEIALEEFERFAIDRLKGEHFKPPVSTDTCLFVCI